MKAITKTISLSDIHLFTSIINMTGELIRAYRPWTIGYTKPTFDAMANLEISTVATIFGEVLMEHRTKNKLSQEELAFRAGVDRTFISRLERGIRQPSLTTILGLAEALQIGADELVKATEKKLLKDEDRAPKSRHRG
jgi:ribosome-binding protein aMBF1 (putative translation factor)